MGKLSNLPAEIKLSNLPAEIISEILCKLPTESVLESKLVCKPWRNLVRHPYFSKLHLLHNPGKFSFVLKTSGGPNVPDRLSFFEYSEMNNDEQPLSKITSKINLSPQFEDYFIIGSSYGLISLIGFNADFYICNPVTKEFLILPEVDKILLPEVKKIPYECVLSGFGYLPLSNEYKVVRIIELGEDPNIEHVVEVYTLGSGTGWKNIGKFKLDVCMDQIYQNNGVFANEILHWVTEDGYIVAFDLADEKFCGIPPLAIPHDDDFFLGFSLGVLGGFLYCAKHEYEMAVETHEMSLKTSGIWVLKKDKGNSSMKDSEEYQSWSWSDEFNGIDFKPLALMKSGAILFSNGTGLFSYDRNSSCSKMLVNYDEPIKLAIPYIKTLVSLKGLGEEDTIIMGQRE